MRRLAWLGVGFAAGVAFSLPRVINLEGELEARDDVDHDAPHDPPGTQFVEHEGYLYPVDPEPDPTEGMNQRERAAYLAGDDGDPS